MIDTFLKLISQVTKLLDYHDKKKKEYFELYVKPTYESDEVVYNDYINLMHDLENLINKSNKVQEIVHFLEQRRLENLSVRMKLRAVLKDREKHENRNRFEYGIMSLMTGTAGSYDRETSNMREQYNLDGHNLLTIITWLIDQGEPNVQDIRDNLLSLIKRIRKRIDKGWQFTVEGYAELQSTIIPNVRR